MEMHDSEGDKSLVKSEVNKIDESHYQFNTLFMKDEQNLKEVTEKEETYSSEESATEVLVENNETSNERIRSESLKYSEENESGFDQLDFSKESSKNKSSNKGKQLKINIIDEDSDYFEDEPDSPLNKE